MKTRIFFGIAAAIALAAPATAWGPRGHMIVAAIAWSHLTPQTRAAVSRLLRHNPLYAQWTHGMHPGAARDQMAFVRAATWPDDIKGGQGYRRDDIHDKPPPGPEAMQNVAFDCIQHRYWHFEDIPFSRDGTPTEPPPAANAEDRIRTFAAVLADRHASDALKSYDLAWLIHLVGDAHQPLHATSRFTADGPVDNHRSDGGGNSIKGPGGRSLHAFWDGLPGNDASPTAAIQAAGAPPWNRPAPVAAAANLDPHAWLVDSERLAEQHAYVAPVSERATDPFVPTAGYQSQALDVAHDQIALAGARLANMLNGAHIRVAGEPIADHTCHAATSNPRPSTRPSRRHH